MLIEYLDQAGEHPFVFQGAVGRLEGIITIPPQTISNHVALIGHPHSLQGGTMNNKVVTTLARAFKELGIPSLRFNFRGVGTSEGRYDAGIGESEDMLILARLLKEETPGLNFFFAGFSFGSYVAYRAAAHYSHTMLITIAPPVHHYNYQEFTPPDRWLLIQGEDDEIVPLSIILEFAQFYPQIMIKRFTDTSHFFHGKLLELKTTLIEVIRLKVLSL